MDIQINTLNSSLINRILLENVIFVNFILIFGVNNVLKDLQKYVNIQNMEMFVIYVFTIYLLFFMLPQKNFWGEHIVAASSVRPSIRVSVRAQFLSGLFLSN